MESEKEEDNEHDGEKSSDDEPDEDMECQNEEDNVHDGEINLEQPSDSGQSESEVRKSLDEIPPQISDSVSSENPLNVVEDNPPEKFLPICESIQSFEELHNVIENTSDKEMANQISDTNQQVDDGIQRHSDTDDTLSVFSDHSYCQRQETMRNDSGFVDTFEEKDQLEANIETLFSQVDDIVANNNEPLAIEEEYQRILHLLEESQKDMIDEQAGKL